jgi:hypothetical protein
MRRLPSIVLLLLLALPGGSADLDVQAKDGRVTVKARAAPLVDVLERLSRETGLELVFEGRRPSQLVTVQIDRLPEAEALSQLFEGLGVDYAFHADAAGRRVKMLFVFGASGAEAAAAAPRGGAVRGPVAARPPEPVEAQEPFSAEEGAAEDEPPEPFGTPAAGQAEDPSAPWPLAPRPDGSAPGFAPPGLSPTPPAFPGSASAPLPAPAFPVSPSVPTAPPGFPNDASSPD